MLMSRLGRRVRRADGESGVYAVLYAVLVVVLIGMAAIVVDLATLKQNRRDDRSAADSAVIAGARFLNPNDAAGVRPREACEAAWRYLEASIVDLKKPSQACDSPTAPNNFPPSVPISAGCPVQYGGPVLAARVSGNTDTGSDYYVTVSWPVVKNSPFLKGDLAPRGGVEQAFDPTLDGADAGCDRIGLAIQHNQEFLLGAVLDVNRGRTTSVSVARIDPNGGPLPEIAALNILKPIGCDTIIAKGNGRIIVNRTDDLRPGIIAVESSGFEADDTTACGGYVLGVQNNGNATLCAAGPAQKPDLAATCDGGGIILQHALDPGKSAATSYQGYPVEPTPVIKPRPTPAGGVYGYLPVTNIYGCNKQTPPVTAALGDCVPPTTNHIDNLVKKLSTDPPTEYIGDDAAYSGTNFGAFNVLPGPLVPDFKCKADKNVVVPAGSWYIKCPGTFDPDSKIVVFQAGTLVFTGGISLSKNGGCLAINVPAANADTCPATENNSGVIRREATTVPRPIQDAIVFVKGAAGITAGSNSNTMLMPQTFVYQVGQTGKTLDLGGGGGTVLWTAPGAGAFDAVTGNRTLKTMCTTGTVISPSCLASRFEKLSYWSEGTGPGVALGGQGDLGLLGIFFVPKEDVQLKGLGSILAANVQFWSYTLANTGQGNLVLTPDSSLSEGRPSGAVGLIR